MLRIPFYFNQGTVLDVGEHSAASVTSRAGRPGRSPDYANIILSHAINLLLSHLIGIFFALLPLILRIHVFYSTFEVN
jgi:hypothetical protein